MNLPADGHVHSQFSWDADQGSMAGTCARAVELGLPAVVFTEHVDFTPFRAGDLVGQFAPLVQDGILTAPVLDVEAYSAAVSECRERFPGLTIATGVEVGQPHLHPEELTALLARGTFDRVLGSLHCLLDGDEYAEPFALFPHHPAEVVFCDYLAQVPAMVDGSEDFTAFAHIDYPVRSWPQDDRPFRPEDFEGEFRTALRSLARGERALEINTRVPLHPTVLAWWVQEGGRRVTFGSDSHEPGTLGHGLARAAELARAHGFRADTRPVDPWLLGR